MTAPITVPTGPSFTRRNGTVVENPTTTLHFCAGCGVLGAAFGDSDGRHYCGWREGAPACKADRSAI